MFTSRSSIQVSLIGMLLYAIVPTYGQPTSTETDATSPTVRPLNRHRLFSPASTLDGRPIARRNAEAWSAIRSERDRFIVEAFPLETKLVDLELQPFRVVGPDTKFVIGRKGRPDVPLDFGWSSISLFRGSVVGHAGSHVYLALSEKRSSGYIDLGPGVQRLHIGSKDFAGVDLPGGDISVFPSTIGAELPPGVPLCGVDGDLQPDEMFLTSPLGQAPAGSASSGTSTVKLKHMELAVDTDYEYFFLFGDETLAAEYLIEMYGAVSDIYQRDVNVWVEVVFARIWTDPDDLYNGDDPVTEFYTYWEANEGGIHRDTAQLLSGRRNYPYGGAAFVSQLCGLAYGVVGYAYGFFPDPTKPSPYTWDVGVTAHELGHVSGTLHTHNYGLDTCDVANTTPRRGSIMSYCDQTWSGMNANQDNFFHTVVRGHINTHVDKSACITPDCNMNSIADSLDISGGVSDDVNVNGIPDECEDCNGNGVLDPTDIAGASLDLNTNGIPDECEPDCNANNVPDDRDIAQGISIDAYGNGIPDECEEDCNNNGTSDHTEIQSDMTQDVNRNDRLDQCEDCDGDGDSDLDELLSAHFLWVASGLDSETIREFHPTTGVLTNGSDGGVGSLVRKGQDLIISPIGHALVSSALDDRIMEFDATGLYLGDFVAPGSGGLDYPTGLLTTPDGTLLVSSRNTNSVLAYDGSTGDFVGTFVVVGSGGLLAPFGLTLSRDGDLLVTSDSNEVLRYDGSTGAFQGAFVDASNNGGLDQPRGLSFKADGNLLVASYGTDEVLEYEWPSGNPLGKWAQVGTATAITQDSPWGIRIGPNGHVYVSRTGSEFSSGGPSGIHNDEHDEGITESHLTDARMFEFNVCTGLFRKTQIGGNDHGLEFATGFDFMPGHLLDCNFNQLTDDCDIASGFSPDTDANGVPDECEIDCNGNGTFDRLDIIPFGTSYDCNCNGIPDECDPFDDCNENGVQDTCDIAAGTSADCNNNGVLDECDIAAGGSLDCDGNGVPDDCQKDCNTNGIADTCDIADGTSTDCDVNAIPDECDPDCNGNGSPDACDIAGGVSDDCNDDSVPDECEPTDCNSNGIPDSCDINSGKSTDCNQDGVPDECELADCNSNGQHDTCEIISGVSPDCNDNGVPDECDIASGFSTDLDKDGIPDECVTDCNGNGRPDAIDVLDGTSEDCTGNGIPDECETDCNQNGQADTCDIAAKLSEDCTGNGVPDECEPDCNQNGQADSCDIADFLSDDCNANGVPDVCDLGVIGEGDPLSGVTVPEGLEATVVASGLARPFGILVSEGGAFGNFIYVAEDPDDTANDRIVRVDPTGLVTEFATEVVGPRAMVFGPRGDFEEGLYVAHNRASPALSIFDTSGNRITRIGDNGAYGLTFGFDNALYTNSYPGGIDRIDASFAVTDFVDQGEMGLVIGIIHTELLAYGDHLFVADESAREVWRVDSNAIVSVFAEPTQWTPNSLAFGNGADFGSGLYVSSLHFPEAVFAVAPDGSTSEFATGFPSRVTGIDFGKGGAFRNDMYVALLDEGLVVRIGSARSLDCNNSGVPDECDVANGTSSDCNANGAPDSCDVAPGLNMDCNTNLVPDECDIAIETSTDCDANSVPDECDVIEHPEFDCNENGLLDACDIATDTSADCDTNGVPDECDILQDPAVDCNGNSAHDACDIADGTSEDCNANGTPDPCEIAELVVADCNGNGIPDECEGLAPQPPSPEAPAFSKNRFLSFTPGNPALDMAIRVTFVDLPPPFDQFNDQVMWVGLPRLVSENGASVDPLPDFPSFAAATLQCEPLFRDWSKSGLVHVFHEFIVPGGSYDVQAITDACDVSIESSYSPALSLSTAGWGDTLSDLGTVPPGPPDGSVDIVDALGIIGRFVSQEGSIAKARADLEPGCIDLTINITDVLAAIKGFQGLAYPFEPTSLKLCESPYTIQRR